MFIIPVSRATTRAVLGLPYPCVWHTPKERRKQAERNKPQQIGPQGNRGEPGKNTLTMDKGYLLMGGILRTWRERRKVQVTPFLNSDHSVLSYKLFPPYADESMQTVGLCGSGGSHYKIGVTNACYSIDSPLRTDPTPAAYVRKRLEDEA